MHDHSHDHSHAGHHHDHHAAYSEKTHKAFVAGIVLNGAYVVVQAIMGFATHSVALLSDAGHNLSDVAALGLSLLAFRLARKKPTQEFTYGYKKTTILAALINSVALFVAIGMLGYESITRLLRPQPVEGGIVAVVAAVGIAINFFSALLFFRHKEHDLNTKGAYMHLMADAIVSLGVVIAGVVIYFTHWYWLDGAISIAILIAIFISTWSLLTGSLRMTVDAVPANIDVEQITALILGISGVESVHHMHIWSMSTTENALTAHVVVDDLLGFDEKLKVIYNVKHELLHNNIHHATIELESPDVPCSNEEC